ncbi:mandelate racemase/muconate lactonizing enzyme family protein [Synoicihabitans lomoniglobus]|uniref:Mandelate racemase/muconate lactonizing enzyme family protein n=1 Tax=Synoicihabitans lomoniglobus TaxID=2909285 RepID=A0AAE9ZV87_9BACT|nr:mandelate racemase/muconate lactonizing enzyme family protein [Opitutaceae bacterium LMO-M01]WED63704.1 mandelate racemase/muconate lactonizing enzyme family protein [Opitutaceae bacterium LMO-M01]
MKITDVTTQLLTARWTDDPSFPQALHSTAIIRIQTDSEFEGLGELTWGYFAPDAVPAMVDYFRPVLIGRDPLAITQLTRALIDDSVWWARSGAGKSVISGLELALWDLKGKAFNVPVWQLLGGAVRERIPVYASGGPSLWPLNNLVRKIEHYAALGYRTAKLSTNYYELPPALDEQVRMTAVAFPFSRRLEVLHEGFTRLRAEFGDTMDFAIDGHQGGVPNPIPVSEAVGIAETLAPFRLRFYEEPLAYTNLDGYAELRSRAQIPLAGGESLCGLDQFHDLITKGGVDVIQPDIGFVGGLQETVRIMHHAEAHNLSTAIHTGASMGPSLAASWHLAAASYSVDWLEHVQAASSIQRDLLVDEFKVIDGTVGLPSAPGLGVRLTPEIIDKYRFVPSSGERT